MKIKSQYILKIVFAIIFIQSSFAFSKTMPDSLNTKNSPIRSVELEYPYIRHLGNFGKVWSNSQGLLLSYGLNYNNHYMMIFKSGYLKTHTREGVNADSSLKVVPLLVGGKYLFNLGSFKPYFSITSGFNLIFGDYTTYSTTQKGFNTTSEKSSRTYFKFFTQFGTGAYFNVYKNINLDLGIRYNNHFYHEESQMTGFEYSIGVAYNLIKPLF